MFLPLRKLRNVEFMGFEVSSCRFLNKMIYIVFTVSLLANLVNLFSFLKLRLRFFFPQNLEEICSTIYS